MSPAAFEPAPLWWEIRLDLKTRGEYKLEEKNSRYSGDYTFAIRWTGCMERDDNDYLLYHFEQRLCLWEAQEAASPPQTRGVLTASDFKEKPSLNLKYILRRDDDLLLNFLVDGIVVPQSNPEGGFPLLFPSSQENGQHDLQVDYNTCVVSGSNSVSLREAEIYAGPVSKNFAWTWKHEQRQVKKQRAVFTSQSHRAEVWLSIIPHYSRAK
jgi:hypothetical protein